ncbi:hypothetical protein ACFXO9_31905 [Nocardia tengchongensis]|uniref:hypothetical protein n=1 Tax=Nocardia tengchongensis TaxID=2055889 RepID=UPI0036CB273C
MEARIAAAIARIDLRRAEGEVPPSHQVMDVDGPLEITGPEHGMRDGMTLCGIPKEQVSVMRNLWFPGGAYACERCRAALG